MAALSTSSRRSSAVDKWRGLSRSRGADADVISVSVHSINLFVKPLVRTRAGLGCDESPAAFEELPHPLGADNRVPGCAPGGARVRCEHDVRVEETQGLGFVAREHGVHKLLAQPGVSSAFGA